MRVLPIALPALLLLACGEPPARITLEPNAARLYGRGQQAKLHANPLSKRGEPMQKHACTWSSTDEKVATVKGQHNDATVTATGAGSAAIRCTIGAVVAEANVAVRLPGKVEVKPAEVELVMQDEPQPFQLQIQAWDDTGALLAGRAPTIFCEDEALARGDSRGQLWAVGPGDTFCTVKVGDASGQVNVKVKDGRSAAAKPKAVKGNPMEAYEKEFARREAERKKEEAKAAAAAAGKK